MPQFLRFKPLVWLPPAPLMPGQPRVLPLHLSPLDRRSIPLPQHMLKQLFHTVPWTEQGERVLNRKAGEREGEREEGESNLKWSDRGQLARDLQGSGRECVEVKAQLP